MRKTKIFCVVIVLLSIAVTGFGGPQPEPDGDGVPVPTPPVPREEIEGRVEEIAAAVGDRGFGIFFDLPHGSQIVDVDSLQIELIKLKSTDESLYLSSNDSFQNLSKPLMEPQYVLFNLDIYLGEPGEEDVNSKKPFDVTGIEDAIVVYIVHKKIGRGIINLDSAPDIQYWIDRTNNFGYGWLSHRTAAGLAEDKTRTGMYKEIHMHISDLVTHKDYGISWFYIFSWPVDDRVICADG